MNSLPIGYKKTVECFLRSGLIGDIGHISCMDRRRSGRHANSQDSGFDELTRRAATQLTEIAKLLNFPADRSDRSIHARAIGGKHTNLSFSG